MAKQTSRLLFRKFEKADFSNYFQLVGDYAVMKKITGVALYKYEAIEKFDDILQVNLSNDETGYYFISLRGTNQFIGQVKIVMTQDEEAEIGCSLLPEFWGKGLGSEITGELVQHARTISTIKKLIAIIDPENEPSKRILKNCGFALDEVCRIGNLPAEIYGLMLKSEAESSKII